jgi:type IV pilus assembly protein PilE
MNANRLAARPTACGFSLVEVLVVLVLAAILLALALPAYREQVARGQRAAAQAALLEDAQSMQRFYSANNTYEGAVDANLATTRSPRDGGAAAYSLSVTATRPTQTTWLLVATPVGPMADDRCGQFTLDETGRKGVLNGTGVTADACWR